MIDLKVTALSGEDHETDDAAKHGSCGEGKDGERASLQVDAHTHKWSARQKCVGRTFGNLRNEFARS